MQLYASLYASVRDNRSDIEKNDTFDRDMRSLIIGKMSTKNRKKLDIQSAERRETYNAPEESALHNTMEDIK